MFESIHKTTNTTKRADDGFRAFEEGVKESIHNDDKRKKDNSGVLITQTFKSEIRNQ